MARCSFTWVAGPVKFDSVLGLGRLWFEYCTLEDGPVMGQLLVVELFFVHSVILEWPVQSGLSGQAHTVAIILASSRTKIDKLVKLMISQAELRWM